jgi:hypothetical protein
MSHTELETLQESHSSEPEHARPSENRMDRIARRAHELYEARSGENGRALDDWLRAEREIDAERDGHSVDRES